MKTIEKYLIGAILTVFLPLTAASCSSSDDNPPISDSGIHFSVPAKIDIMQGGDYTFNVPSGSVPLTTDFLMLEASNGVLHISPIEIGRAHF